jgi:hypothetical protein
MTLSFSRTSLIQYFSKIAVDDNILHSLVTHIGVVYYYIKNFGDPKIDHELISSKSDKTTENDSHFYRCKDYTDKIFYTFYIRCKLFLILESSDMIFFFAFFLQKYQSEKEQDW